ncbi:MAG: isovaleryl-CoA dehydrogenase [Pyrinomonadaceae bacterium]
MSEKLQYDDRVFNQSPALEDYNPFASDEALSQAVRVNNGGWVAERASGFAEILGRAETLKLGDLANRFAPVLKTHDRFGNRADEVEYHPAYHELMRLSIEHETHSLAWKNGRKGAHAARSALMFLRHQVDEGSSCPLTMTFAVVPSLKIQKEIADEWLPRVLSDRYDPRLIPATEKKGAIFGMAMTERQGGSDVRANTSVANPVGPRGAGREYRITGHKWFCSAPMSDAFLVLARTEGGLSCFLLPRFTPDGRKNDFHLQRLKDKLGNRSNASSEVEFRDAWALLIGEEGRGVANIIEMVRHTRLDCITGSAATLRRAVAESINHARHRRTFGKFLIDQPLMRNVLADLCLESEAATALAFRLSRSFDEAETDEHENFLARIGTAVGKFWVTKRAVAALGEAIECLGGNGYVEESAMPRLYRDIPVNSIWEGSGNVQCLDVLRAAAKEPETLRTIRAEASKARGENRDFDLFLDRLDTELSDLENPEIRARRLVEMLALALQAAVLIRTAPGFIADAFCRSRLGAGGFSAFGTLPADADFRRIIERNLPVL